MHVSVGRGRFLLALSRHGGHTCSEERVTADLFRGVTTTKTGARYARASHLASAFKVGSPAFAFGGLFDGGVASFHHAQQAARDESVDGAAERAPGQGEA